MNKINMRSRSDDPFAMKMLKIKWLPFYCATFILKQVYLHVFTDRWIFWGLLNPWCSLFIKNKLWQRKCLILTSFWQFGKVIRKVISANSTSNGNIFLPVKIKDTWFDWTKTTLLFFCHTIFFFYQFGK